ncbi:MAG: MBL fold metallo-hydrolase [Acidimicrobiaceae bacterium]|nr:MBL fold metallo-hydrolase [Acidimicrobiaceae bacterium]
MRDMQLPTGLAWHAVDVCEANILRVTEAYVDSYAVGDIWLVQGSDLDVAVDAGSGIVPAGPLIEAISRKPVLCIALTCSYDHAGGWHSFQQRACHRLDESSLADPVEENTEIADYLTDDMFRALPSKGFNPASHQMIGAAATRIVDDGEIIDLGTRSLEVLHTPGRSSGGVCVWEAATATLFTGEMLYDGSHGPAWPPSDSGAYCQSLRRIRRLPAETVHAGHYGSFGRARMIELIESQLADLESR